MLLFIDILLGCKEPGSVGSSQVSDNVFELRSKSKERREGEDVSPRKNRTGRGSEDVTGSNELGERARSRIASEVALM